MKSYASILFFLINIVCFSQSKIVDENNDLRIKWILDRKHSKVPIAQYLGEDNTYLITNDDETSGNSERTPSNLELDGELLKYQGRPIFIYDGGSAIVEGKNISIVRPDGITNDKNLTGKYNNLKDEPANRAYPFAFKANYLTCLIAKLKSPKYFRINIGEFKPPSSRDLTYILTVIVDGKPLHYNLVNSTSVDVYGKEIYVAFRGSPGGVGLWSLNGNFSFWD